MGCCGSSNTSEGKQEKQEKPAESKVELSSEKQEEGFIELPDNIPPPSKSLIEIENPNKNVSGFLFKVSRQRKEERGVEEEELYYYFFITLKENITKEMIEKKETIKLYYDNKKSFKMISLNSEERIIKDFSDIGIDSIIIQILESDNIEKEYFLPIMKQHDEFQDLINDKINIIQKEKNEINFSKGKIKKIEKNEFIYSSNIDTNSPGNPIFFIGCKEAIGIQKSGMNCAYFLGPIYYYLRGYNEENTQEEKESEGENAEIKEEKAETKEKKEIKGKIEGNKIIYEDGKYYIGDIKDEKRHGKGIQYDKEGEIIYEGDWIEDKYEGNGKLIEKYGEYYIGQFKKGEKHGKGIKYYENEKKKYEGDFINNILEGKGIEYNDDGTKKFEGEFVAGVYEGEGKLYYHDGDLKYSGHWKDGKKNGKGILYISKGKKEYEGDFFNDLFEGKGKYYNYYGGKLQYEGEWELNKRQGKGKIYDKDGKIICEGDFESNEYYIGEKKDGKKHGKGTLYLLSHMLSRYEGEFVNDLYEGKGKYFDDIHKNLISYIGGYKEGKRHGKGIQYHFEKNKLQYEGDFVNGKFEGIGKLVEENGEYYIGQFADCYPHSFGVYYYANGQK